MSLQKLMNIDHCVFNIIEKKVSRADGHTEGRTDGWADGQRENNIPHHKKKKDFRLSLNVKIRF